MASGISRRRAVLFATAALLFCAPRRSTSQVVEARLEPALELPAPLPIPPFLPPAAVAAPILSPLLRPIAAISRPVAAAPRAARRRASGLNAVGHAAASSNFWDGSRPLNVLMAASEAVPFVKTGGLADVVDALGRGLARAGQRVVLVLPKYKELRLEGAPLQPVPGTLDIPIANRVETARLLRLSRGGMDVYLIEQEGYFGREGIYSSAYDGRPDDDERFIFFSRAVLEAARLAGFRPDVVHAHDWPTALTSAFLKTLYAADPFFSATASVLTVHNLAYQGLFPREALAKAGLDAEAFHPQAMELNGLASFLKAGLVHADKVATVSRSYAQETRGSPRFGCGLEGLLASRGPDYRGIVNGVDLELWNPSTDPRLAARYGVEDAARGKALNKRAFQLKHGLEPHPRAPLIGIAARIAPQKGFDLVAEIAPALVRMGVQLAIIGSAAPQDAEGLEIERRLGELALRHPRQVFFHSFDLELPSLIFAASDFYFAPSRFEPCGLSQQFAMLYGSLPIAAPVGGLLDTVRDAEEGAFGTGFFIRELTPRGLMNAVARALAAYRSPETLGRLVTAAMSRDASWDAAISEYLELYREALAGLRGSRK